MARKFDLIKVLDNVTSNIEVGSNVLPISGKKSDSFSQIWNCLGLRYV